MTPTDHDPHGAPTTTETGTATAAPADMATATAPEPRGYANPGRPQGPPMVRTGTMVWGLITVLVGLAAIAVAAGRQVDLEIALISLFIIAGMGLLAGSAVSALQRNARTRRRTRR